MCRWHSPCVSPHCATARFSVNNVTDREEIRGVAETHGWQILRDGNQDRYHKTIYDIDVFYDEQDNAKEAHARRYGTGIASVTGRIKTKAQVTSWLKSPPPVSV